MYILKLAGQRTSNHAKILTPENENTKRETKKQNEEERRKGEEYDVCEFWRIHKPEENRETDHVKEDGRYAWSVRTVSDGCGKGQA